MTAQKSTTRRPAPTYGDDRLDTLQRSTFRYFWEETNPENGLIPDNTSAGDVPASIAGVGLALASYPVAAEHSFVLRAQAYMDVAPVGTANGQTVVLLHGGSYYGWYWPKVSSGHQYSRGASGSAE